MLLISLKTSIKIGLKKMVTTSFQKGRILFQNRMRPREEKVVTTFVEAVFKLL